MATELQVFKLNALPGTFVPSALYLIPGADDLLNLYVANAAGDAVRNIISKPEIEALITTAVAGASGGSTLVAADITARDALVLTSNAIVLVVDASADTSVTSGAATYVYDATAETWTKIAEFESMDVALDWTNIQNGPSASAAAIDDAVGKAHTHSNLVVLEKFGEDVEGSPTYDGQPIAMTLAANEW